MAAIVSCLVTGARKSDGTPVASGYVYFYEIGTLTTLPVYSDDDATDVLTQPIRLDAGGRPLANNGSSRTDVYTTSPARMIVQDSTGADVLDVERVNGVIAADADDIRADALESFGDERFRYLPAGSATNAMLMKDWMTGLFVNVKAFGALGDDATDDITAITAAIAYASGLTRPSPVYFPPGIYRHSTPIAVTTSGVSLLGAGASLSILKNTSTTGNAVTFASANDCYVENLKVTSSSDANTGKAILATACNRFTVSRCVISGHDYGVEIAGASYSSRIYGCDIDPASTVTVGSSCVKLNTTGGASVGHFIESCSFNNVNSYIGARLIGVYGTAGSVVISGCVFARGEVFYLDSAAAGFGFTMIGCVNSLFGDVAITIGPTGIPIFTEIGNSWTAQPSVTDSSTGRLATWGSTYSTRAPVGIYGTQTATALGVSGTLTPSLLTGYNFLATLTEPGGGGTIVLTVANPTNSTLAKYRGVPLTFHIKILGNNISGITWGSEYKTDGVAVVAFNKVHTYRFEWDGTHWRQTSYTAGLV